VFKLLLTTIRALPLQYTHAHLQKPKVRLRLVRQPSLGSAELGKGSGYPSVSGEEVRGWTFVE
jgi:hypothetical protein